jgi:hypothetical protein
MVKPTEVVNHLGSIIDQYALKSKLSKNLIHISHIDIEQSLQNCLCENKTICGLTQSRLYFYPYAWKLGMHKIFYWNLFRSI